MSALNSISPENLMRLLGTADAPEIVDLRIPEDRHALPLAIPTAFHHTFEDCDGLIQKLGGRKAVLVCHKGLKISHGVAGLLRGRGVDAEVLEGGMVAWLETGQIATPSSKRSAVPERKSRWVTRHRPKIDRIACPWLIRRFIDPQAEFLFVPPDTVLDVAACFDAVPFDVPDVVYSHHGENCSFDALIADFALSHAALDLLATVVRAADTNRHDLAPQASGLLALSVGLSRMFKNDHAQLEAGIGLYDALYRWARDGKDEGHDWPGEARA